MSALQEVTMKMMTSLLGLLVFVMAPASYASIVQCQYRTEGGKRGVFKMDLESYSVTLTDRFNNPDNDYVYEQGREIVCGEGQNVRAVMCHHEQNRNGTEIQWSIRCDREAGNNVWAWLSDARVNLDLNAGEGTYTCKSFLSQNQRSYFDLTHCIQK